MAVQRSAGTYLCHLSALPDGGARGFDPTGAGRDTIMLIRQGPRVHAWVDACPHVDGAPMAWRKDAYLSGDGRHIVCHAHGAQFDISSGLCTLGPCEGQGLRPVPLVQQDDGALYLAPHNETETHTS